MGMVVQHNMSAMNANRQLGSVTTAQAKSTEKLSSGYRINRAGDDAAGLKISEKMRSQIRGLNKASSNAQDGVSLIQTAEGALTEAHSILQRMNELAVQGANDTNVDIDRDAINEELAQLTEELDRISSTTQFNKQNLLDGSFTSKNLHVGANSNQKIAISIGNMDATSLGLKSISMARSEEDIAADIEAGTSRQTGSGILGVSYNGVYYSYDSSKTVASNAGLAYNELASAIKAQYSGNAADQYVYQFNGTSMVYEAINAVSTNGTDKLCFSAASAALQADLSAALSTFSATVLSNAQVVFSANTNMGSVIANSAMPGTTPASVASVTTMNAPSVSDYSKANATIDAVQEAINRVSSQRSALGALQNRLEHTIANLDNVSENTQSAESRIRDTDMASEMVEYSKNNILAQAGQSMLAQANQSTQGILSLLG